MTTTALPTTTTAARALRGRIDGAVVSPSDTGYDEARGTFNLTDDLRPALVAFPRDEREVVAVVDVAWGLGFVLVAVVSAVLGDTPVRWVLLGMVAVWGLRLAWHIGRRQVQHPHEDPRYEALLGGGGFATAVRKVFVIQGVSLWVVSLPV